MPTYETLKKKMELQKQLNLMQSSLNILDYDLMMDFSDIHSMSTQAQNLMVQIKNLHDMILELDILMKGGERR